MDRPDDLRLWWRIPVAVVAGAIAVLAGLIAYYRFRSLWLPIEASTALLGGLSGIWFLRRARPALRCAVAVALLLASGVGSHLAIAATPPSAEELAAATRLVHDSPLKATVQRHFGGFTNDGFFCLPSCGVRFEQSDMDASTTEAVRSIVSRLRESGYRVGAGPADAGAFLNIEPQPPALVVGITARRRSVDLAITVASTDRGSVVASYAR